MNNYFIQVLGVLSLLFFAEITVAQAPEVDFTRAEVEAHLRFLASDELQGRRTGEAGNNIAARYIATFFEAYGATKAPGLDSYYQSIPFANYTPPTSGAFEIEGEAYEYGKDFFFLSGDPTEFSGKAVFANFGWVDETTGHDDYKGLNVKGKVVFTLPGRPDSQDPTAVFMAMQEKQRLAKENGAVALIELYRLQFPWTFFLSYFNKKTLRVDDNPNSEDTAIAYGWLKEKDKTPFAKMQDGKKVNVTLKSEAFKKEPFPSQNVIGIIEGSDPDLKKEYVVLTAHYDHVGTGKNGGGAFTEQDSIFNGARDNGMGTVALMMAGKAFSQQKTKRSIILLAVTGEELGLLGSAYYAANPIIPLEETVYNFNTDGAGYNDKTSISIIGSGRTGTDKWVEKSAEIFGLNVIKDPAPEQNLFDRSDNVSFAAKGVPALAFSPGVTGFDEELMKYYHQVVDNPNTIDFDYFLKYCQSFVHTARLIADDPNTPFWKGGDKYEAAGKALYNK